MTKLESDIFEWDAKNWSRAFKYCDLLLSKSHQKPNNILELGAAKGGLSLYAALKFPNAYVKCTDYISDKRCIEDYFSEAKKKHHKYGVEKNIEYDSLDALAIEENSYDLIMFKSVLGAVGRNNNYNMQKAMMTSIFNGLKPGGICCFVENLHGNFLVRALRKRFSKASNNGWRYSDIDEIKNLCSDFSEVHISTTGVFACAGPCEPARRFIANLDFILEKTVRPKNRYIVSVIARK